MSIVSYTDPLLTKRIDVYQDSSASHRADVSLLDENGRVKSVVQNLPLQGLPKGVSRDKINVCLLDAYFVPEKDIDGIYNRVHMRFRGEGGNPKIPFQPGLALGSVISGEQIQGMRDYAKNQAKQDQLEDQIRNAEIRLEALQTKITTRAGKPDNDALRNLYEQQVKDTQDYIRSLTTSLANVRQSNLPVITNFLCQQASPIDMGNSRIEIQPRSFDSTQFSSQYISMSATKEEIQDKIKRTSDSLSISAGGSWLLNSAQFNRTQSDAVTTRLQQIKSQNIAQGVLVINVFVTTRNVRCFTKMSYRPEILKELLSVMRSGDEAKQKEVGIFNAGDKKAVAILTEAVCGGSFTALVTFLDKSKMSRTTNTDQNEATSTTSANISGGYSVFSANAGFANAGTTASRNENDVLSSISQTGISIEFFSQGAIPVFNRNVLEKEVLRHLKLDPSKYELSDAEAANAEKIVKSTGTERQVAVLQHDMKMQQAQVGILNTYRGMSSEKQIQNVHTMESVMGAYENFAEQITSDKECGVPIAFNFITLSETEIERLLSSSQSAPAAIGSPSATQALASPTVQQIGAASPNTSTSQ